MADGMPMMPWYEGDFMRSTRGWTVTAKGVYREILCAQWDAGTLPEDPEELRMMIGATAAEWSAGWRRCESKFPIVEGGGRRNHRLEEHRERSLHITKRRSDGARIANAKRYGQRPESGTLGGQSASGQRSHPEPEPEPYPILASGGPAGSAKALFRNRDRALQVIRDANPAVDPETLFEKWSEYVTAESITLRHPEAHLTAFAKGERFSESQWNRRKASDSIPAPAISAAVARAAAGLKSTA